MLAIREDMELIMTNVWVYFLILRVCCKSQAHWTCSVLVMSALTCLLTLCDMSAGHQGDSPLRPSGGRSHPALPSPGTSLTTSCLHYLPTLNQGTLCHVFFPSDTELAWSMAVSWGWLTNQLSVASFHNGRHVLQDRLCSATTDDTWHEYMIITILSLCEYHILPHSGPYTHYNTHSTCSKYQSHHMIMNDTMIAFSLKLWHMTIKYTVLSLIEAQCTKAMVWIFII